ncbi:hypothetical protein BDR22DRAFT_485347 [Usnea florida]
MPSMPFNPTHLHLLVLSFPYVHSLSTTPCSLSFPPIRAGNLHSIHRLDPFLCGILNVRHVCQRREIEKHRFDKIR